MLPTGFRTFHFVSFLYVFFFSFLFLFFLRFFSHYFVCVFLRFVFFFVSFRFFSPCFLFVFFSFRFFSFLFIFPFLSLQVPAGKRLGHTKWREYKEKKGRDLTQSYDKSPYFHRKVQKAVTTQNKTKQNFDYTTIADRLTTATQLV